MVNLNLQKLTEISSYIRLEDGTIVDEFPKMVASDGRKMDSSLKNTAAVMFVSMVIGERLMNYSSRFFYSNGM